MLYSAPELDSEDERVLAEIEGYRRDLRYQIAEPHRWQGQLRRSLVAGAIQGSNSIEGIVVSIEDAEALVAGEDLSAEVEASTRDAVSGYRDALTWVHQAPQMRNFRYDEMLLSALHFMIQKYDMTKWPGRYRPGTVYIGSRHTGTVYTAPDVDRVPDLMAELVGCLNDDGRRLPAIVRASMAHVNLAKIHPWRDGNGRMSRCLHTLVLAREGVLAPEFSSIEEWLGEQTNTLDYYRVLRNLSDSWQPASHTREWLRFCLTAHHKQAQVVQRDLDRTVRVWEAMSELAEMHGLAERVVTALYAASGGHLRRTTYQRDEGLTRDQAVRDIRTLSQLGLVEARGHARTRTYVPAGQARERAAAVRERLRRGPLREPYPD